MYYISFFVYKKTAQSDVKSYIRNLLILARWVVPKRLLLPLIAILSKYHFRRQFRKKRWGL